MQDGFTRAGRRSSTAFHYQCRILIDRYGLDPARTFYTDDMQYNVDGARTVGLDAELFTGATELRTQLRSRGLSV